MQKSLIIWSGEACEIIRSSPSRVIFWSLFKFVWSRQDFFVEILKCISISRSSCVRGRLTARLKLELESLRSGQLQERLKERPEVDFGRLSFSF